MEVGEVGVETSEVYYLKVILLAVIMRQGWPSCLLSDVVTK